MSYPSEPSREWQEQKHQQNLQKDPIAFAELCELALPHLVSFLASQFPQQDAHLPEIIAIDCLLDYQKKPQHFDPQKLSLFAYFRMATRRDMLNKIDKNRRRERRLTDIDDPAVQFQLPDNDNTQENDGLDEWLLQHTDLSRQEILEALDAELDEDDSRILLLMLDGVRETSEFASVLGISHLDELEQRKEVKRAKDRLTKKLQRFGKRIDRT